MRFYLQHFRRHQRRWGSSWFDAESIPRTEGMAHVSGIASGTILGDLVNKVPPMLYGLSIIGAGTCFPLPRADTLLSFVDPANGTHVSLLTLFGFLLFLYLLSDPSTLQVPSSTAQSWYTAAISTHKYFVEFTSAERMFSFIGCLLFIFYANECIHECM